MPELPEVETIKNQLNNFLPLKIKHVFFSDKTSRLIRQKDFKLESGIITNIYRKGKFLIFNFDNPDHFLISHLGMSGSWRISDKKLVGNEAKHAHIVIEGDKKVLSYVDPRRFGLAYFLNKENFEKKINSFPIDISEPTFDAVHIKNIFDQNPNKVLKTLLLDQKKFSGVGNYIASEICARAKILPTRVVSTLTQKDCTNIKAAIDLIIYGALKGSGTTFGGGYRDAFGEKGEGVNHLVVFHQKICQMCKKTEVIKITLGGRGTYYCPHCQK